MKACKAMCSDIIVIYDVFGSLDLCINSKKSALLLKLVGTEAEHLVNQAPPAGTCGH